MSGTWTYSGAAEQGQRDIIEGVDGQDRMVVLGEVIVHAQDFKIAAEPL